MLVTFAEEVSAGGDALPVHAYSGHARALTAFRSDR
jgi:hypothetical protein